MITAPRPRAASTPAAMAISLPKLRENDRAVMRGSAAFSSRATSSVLSLEPSSTKMISKLFTQASAGMRRATSARRLSPSLNTGMMTESSGVSSACVRHLFPFQRPCVRQV